LLSINPRPVCAASIYARTIQTRRRSTPCHSRLGTNGASYLAFFSASLCASTCGSPGCVEHMWRAVCMDRHLTCCNAGKEGAPSLGDEAALARYFTWAWSGTARERVGDELWGRLDWGGSGSPVVHIKAGTEDAAMRRSIATPGYTQAHHYAVGRLLHTTTEHYTGLRNDTGYYRRYGTTGKSRFC
ncbi:hypothetical protein DFH09DRAFT_1438051, partial [Mycena vulgaris]